MSRRHRWAAVASTLALVCTGGAGVLLFHAEAYVNSQVVSDPAGDANTTVDAQGHPTEVGDRGRPDGL